MSTLRHLLRVIVTFAVPLIVYFMILPLCLHNATAEDPISDAAKQEAQARKERYTNWMRKYAEGTKIRIHGQTGVEADDQQLGVLVSNPIFRYSDEERRIPDATLWVWTRDSRPMAFQKVEGNNHGGGQAWTICFASLSEELISVNWPMGRNYASRIPGVTFKPIPDADAPADNSRARTAQLKTIKDRFTGRINVNQDETGGSEARTIPKPLFEYADPNTKLPQGAIFGMTSTGTNPDLLLLIETRRDGAGKWRWEYAHARMTSGSVRVRLDDVEIWSEKPADNGAFENWIFYFLPRDFK